MSATSGTPHTHSRMIVLLAALTATFSAVPAHAFDFDDLKTVEQAEQGELLEKARQAARSWNFSSAHSYLNQARQKGYAPKEVRAVESLIAKNETAKAEKDRREEEARQARLAAEQRAAEASRRQGSSSSGGKSIDRVLITSDCIGAFCLIDKLQVSGGPGFFTNTATSSGVITKGYNGLAGQYSYTVKVENHWCSGSFYVSGTKSTFAIRVYNNCKDAGSGEY